MRSDAKLENGGTDFCGVLSEKKMGLFSFVGDLDDLQMHSQKIVEGDTHMVNATSQTRNNLAEVTVNVSLYFQIIKYIIKLVHNSTKCIISVNIAQFATPSLLTNQQCC